MIEKQQSKPSVLFLGIYFVWHDEKVLFIKPLSFMNLSGEVVKRYIDYYKINDFDNI